MSKGIISLPPQRTRRRSMKFVPREEKVGETYLLLLPAIILLFISPALSRSKWNLFKNLNKKKQKSCKRFSIESRRRTVLHPYFHKVFANRSSLVSRNLINLVLFISGVLRGKQICNRLHRLIR